MGVSTHSIWILSRKVVKVTHLIPVTSFGEMSRHFDKVLSARARTAAQCVILTALAFACMAKQPLVRLQTTQPLSKLCKSTFRRMNACVDPAADLDKWRRVDRICCEPLNQSLRFICQEGLMGGTTKYIVQACMAEQRVPPGQTLRLFVTSNGSVNFETRRCQDGYFENTDRKSYEVISPACRRKKKTCDERQGEVVLLDGGATADNRCGCGLSYTVKGHSGSACTDGFGADLSCYCERCPDNFRRSDDDNTTCVLTTAVRTSVNDTGVFPNSTTVDFINAAMRTPEATNVHAAHKLYMVASNFIKVLAVCAYGIFLLVTWTRCS